jgi:small subunit ribosomal protein S6
MNYYETLYIIHPALESGRLKDIILSTQSMFEGVNIEVLSTNLWGKKKLAYLIDKQQYGTYVLVQLKSNGENINKISTELEHNPDILAYLTNKISESEIHTETRTLDEQILGSKSSEPEAPKSDKSTKEPSEPEAPKSDKSTKEPSEPEALENDNENKELTSEENNGTNK